MTMEVKNESNDTEEDIRRKSKSEKYKDPQGKNA